MEIITLPWGRLAPKESDCVHVEEVADGQWTLNTSALSACSATAEGESDATIGSAPYDSYDAAEAAGLAIAADQCAATVYVSRARLSKEPG
ncbi:hypothetical protein [Sphingomonas sp.]|uniref:hypothetical protein n=1 Tax=Sphingomonas sp. TaxID=28214 RepID=UPI003CC57F03